MQLPGRRRRDCGAICAGPASPPAPRGTPVIFLGMRVGKGNTYYVMPIFMITHSSSSKKKTEASPNCQAKLHFLYSSYVDINMKEVERKISIDKLLVLIVEG